MTTLDALANALKALGFSRPPGSPRLITRLRRIRGLEVSRSGQITLVDAGAEPAAEAQPSAGFAQDAVEDDEPTPGNEWPPVREPRPITYEDRRAAVEAAQYGGSPSAPPPPESAPGDGAQPGDGGQRRRRSRRGGRGRRRHAAL